MILRKARLDPVFGAAVAEENQPKDISALDDDGYMSGVRPLALPVKERRGGIKSTCKQCFFINKAF